jgi:hypothetical protein
MAAQDDDAKSRVGCFLVALFEETAEKIKHKDIKGNPIAEFRKFMSMGQSMAAPGKQREEFYNRVISKAAEVWCELAFIQIFLIIFKDAPSSRRGKNIGST